MSSSQPTVRIIMTSKPIYFCVYRITNLVLKKHYYGYKSSVEHPSQVLGISYWSSLTGQEGIDFENDQIQNPTHYRYKIIKIFDNKNDAISLEIKLHNMFDVAKNPNFYNKSKQTSNKFDVSGMTAVKDRSGNQFLTSVDDPRFLSGELRGINHGNTTLVDSYGNQFKGNRYNQKVISGEYVSRDSKKILIETKTGDILWVYKNDINLIIGDYILSNRKRVKRPAETEETKRRKSESHKGKPSGALGKSSKSKLGKKPARDKNGNSLGIISLIDTRWGISIFSVGVFKLYSEILLKYASRSSS